MISDKVYRCPPPDCALQANSDDVITNRGGIEIENTYCIHAAIVAQGGRLRYSFGDLDRVTLARTAAKPVLALVILEALGAAGDRFHLDDTDIAHVCTSHRSEPSHISMAHGILKRAGANEYYVACGGHPALSAAVN